MRPMHSAIPDRGVWSPSPLLAALSSADAGCVQLNGAPVRVGENAAADSSGCAIWRQLSELCLILYPRWSLEAASLLLDRVSLLLFWVGRNHSTDPALIQSIKATDVCRTTYGFGYGIAIWGNISGPELSNVWESGADVILGRDVHRRPAGARFSHPQRNSGSVHITRSAL